MEHIRSTCAAGTYNTEFPSISKKTGLEVLELKGREIFEVSSNQTSQ